MKKAVAVIGGTGTIGYEICKFLTKEYKVYLIGRNEKQVKKQSESLKDVTGLVGDVTNIVSIKKVFKKINKSSKNIYAVINLAGVFFPFGNFEKITIEDNKLPIEVNLLGAYNVTHSILPLMKKKNQGKIILFSGAGVGGDLPLVNAASYYVSKAAISVFAEVIAKEVENFNIQINSILPGQILSKSTKKTFTISQNKLGPVLGPATENLKKTGGNSVKNVLELINFLLSEKSNNISGRLLSAKWDDLSTLKKISDEKYKLRRIEGNIYKKSKRG